MRRLLVLCALALAAACGPTRQDLEVDWTFDGVTCKEAGVATILVDLAGEVLTPNSFSCRAGTQVNTGAYLGRYLAGGYDLTVTGLDATNALLYRKTVRIEVSGRAPLKVPIDLRSSSATLRWAFDGKTCAQAGVTSVTASVDGQALTDAANNADLPCSQGGIDGVTVAPLSAGAHKFDLVGYVGNRAAYVLSGLQVTVVQGQDTAVAPSLAVAAPTTGTANLYWSFENLTCAQAHVDLVRIAYDPRPDGTGGADAGTVACSNAGVEGAVIDSVPPGTHSFAVTGVRHTAAGDKLVYETHAPGAGTFQVGLTTDVTVNASASAPARGGTALLWSFPAGGPSCTAAQGVAVTYTLTDPAGHVQPAQTSACGGGTTGIDVCYTGPGNASCPGIASGLWTVTATASSGGTNYAANAVRFGVPNNDHGQATIAFR